MEKQMKFTEEMFLPAVDNFKEAKKYPDHLSPTGPMLGAA